MKLHGAAGAVDIARLRHETCLGFRPKGPPKVNPGFSIAARSTARLTKIGWLENSFDSLGLGELFEGQKNLEL